MIIMKKVLCLIAAAIIVLSAFAGCQRKVKSEYAEPTVPTVAEPVTSAYDEQIDEITAQIEKACQEKIALSESDLNAIAEATGSEYKKDMGKDNHVYLFQVNNAFTFQVYTSGAHYVEFYIDRILYTTKNFK